MVDGTFAGDPEGIVRTGSRARELAGSLDEAVASRQARLTMPGGATTGWAVDRVAAAVTGDWQTHLARLAERVEEFGADLVTAGSEYRASDDSAARRLR